MNDEQFGYFLAGLIDADGHINKKELAITMHSKDISVAEFLKQAIGGSIRNIKGRRAINYEVYSKAGLSAVVYLIHGKLRLPHRVNQYNSHLVPKFDCLPARPNMCGLLYNHWYAGFIQGDGSFQIKFYKAKTASGFRVQLTMQISLKTRSILTDIKNNFGGAASVTERLTTRITIAAVALLMRAN